MIRGASTVLAALVVGAVVGCGSGGAEVPGGADAEDARVIMEWADALRQGDLDEATSLFRVPSLVQNGTLPLELDSEEDVRLFNESLPCGAKLTRAEEVHEGVVVATFELTERPGPGECGSGTGQTARTAFVIEDGLIVQWRRVPDEAPEPEVTGPIV